MQTSFKESWNCWGEVVKMTRNNVCGVTVALQAELFLLHPERRHSHDQLEILLNFSDEEGVAVRSLRQHFQNIGIYDQEFFNLSWGDLIHLRDSYEGLTLTSWCDDRDGDPGGHYSYIVAMNHEVATLADCSLGKLIDLEREYLDPRRYDQDYNGDVFEGWVMLLGSILRTNSHSPRFSFT